MAEKKNETVAEFARRRSAEIAETDVDGTLKVKWADGLATFTGSGYNEFRQSVELHFGDGTMRRVGTVNGELQPVRHEYPQLGGPFEAYTKYSGADDEIVTRRVSVPEE